MVAPVTTVRAAGGGCAAAEPLVVILLGPTGSGKTALSLALGELFGGEIVSCDSVAVYRGMELGTAKPTTEERARLEKSRKRHGEGWLHRLLGRLDPASAARIHANDTPKLIRAIEVCLAERKPMSQVLARNPLTGFRLLHIGLNPPRQALYERLNQRAVAMFTAGLIDETRCLLARYGPVKALDSLGYRQAMAALAGTLSEEAAIEATQQGHRNYAKRQLTWFRREPEVYWIAGFGDEPETISAAAKLIDEII